MSLDNKFEIRFYHSRVRALELALTKLLEKNLINNQRSVVRLIDEAMCDYYDEYLWTYSEDSFLPHGSCKVGNAEYQKIWLTSVSENPNQSEVLFVAGVSEIEPDIDQQFKMLCYVFGDDNQSDKDNARKEWARWRQALEDGKIINKISYWKQDKGKWRLEKQIGCDIAE